MKELKKKLLVHSIVSMIIGLAVGILILVIGTIITPKTVNTIIKWAIIIYGVFVIIGNIPGLIDGISRAKEPFGIFDIVMSALGILLGLAMIIWRDELLVVIVACYLIVFPLLRVLLSDRKGEQFKKELLSILLGVVLLVFVPSLLGAAFELIHWLLLIGGAVVIVLTLVTGIVSILRISRMPVEEEPPESGSRLYVDVDGDGTIDEIIDSDRK